MKITLGRTVHGPFTISVSFTTSRIIGMEHVSKSEAYLYAVIFDLNKEETEEGDLIP